MLKLIFVSFNFWPRLYTTAVILTSKPLFKLDNLWMPTAVTPLEDSLESSLQKPIPALFPRSIKKKLCVFIVVSDLWSDSLRWKKLKLAPFFNAALNVIEKTEKCQIFFIANILSEFQSHPRSNHLVFQKYL